MVSMVHYNVLLHLCSIWLLLQHLGKAIFNMLCVCTIKCNYVCVLSLYISSIKIVNKELVLANLFQGLNIFFLWSDCVFLVDSVVISSENSCFQTYFCYPLCSMFSNKYNLCKIQSQVTPARFPIENLPKQRMGCMSNELWMTTVDFSHNMQQRHLQLCQ